MSTPHRAVMTSVLWLFIGVWVSIPFANKGASQGIHFLAESNLSGVFFIYAGLVVGLSGIEV